MKRKDILTAKNATACSRCALASRHGGVAAWLRVIAMNTLPKLSLAALVFADFSVRSAGFCRPRRGGRVGQRKGAVQEPAARIQHRAAVGLERPADRGANPEHAARPGRPEGETGLGPPAPRIDDALSVQGLVPALEGRAQRGRAAGYERLDLRRELLSLRLRGRLGAGADAGIARPGPDFPRGQGRAEMVGGPGRRLSPGRRPL